LSDGGLDQTSIDIAASRLRLAQESLTPCAPVRDLLAPMDLRAAYEVQSLNNDLQIDEGLTPAGWKIGLTSLAVQRQLGVDQPDFGRLFANWEIFDDLPASPSTLLQPRVEAEVAFVLDADLDQSPVRSVDVLRATAFVVPAIEIVASRITNWDISIVDTVADNASSGSYVIGSHPTLLSAVDLREVVMEMSGPSGIVSSGSGSACLGHPVNAVVWLANRMADLGSPLRTGDLVLSGALGPMADVEPGGTYEATITGLGSVRARFAELEA
jgi:2-keto-4-pentenoate hydratase